MVNDVETIESVQFLDSSKDCLGVSLLSESLGPSEGSVGPDLGFTGLMNSLLDSGGDFLGDLYNNQKLDHV